MLLIPCPYCGPRAELEFSYGGQAHVPRPAPGSAPAGEAWTAFQYERSNDKGPARRALAAYPRLWPLLQRGARHHHRQDPAKLPERGNMSGSLAECRSRPDRSRPSNPLQFRWPLLPRSGRRYAGLRVARERSAPGRSLLQIPPSARLDGGRARRSQRSGHGPARCRPLHAQSECHAGRTLRGPGGRKPEPLAFAAMGLGQTNDFFSRFIPAGFYYKTFMWPRKAWHRWYEPRIRAAAGLGPRPCSGRPGQLRAALLSLRCPGGRGGTGGIGGGRGGRGVWKTSPVVR